jgi:acetylornithine deacetylase/succinyl-diaminopimelate desuccinylase-like protein
MSDVSSKQQAGPLFRWLLDLRQTHDESKKTISNSAFHDQLATKDKRPNTTTAEFKLGNINKVRHVLDAKTTTHADCSFMFNLRQYNNQSKHENKNQNEKWIDCP